MKCEVRGSKLRPTITDLPFRAGQTAFVILKGLPVLECGACLKYLLEDDVLARVEKIFAWVESKADLEIVRYVA